LYQLSRDAEGDCIFATTADKNHETPCRVLPLFPFAMLKKLQNLVLTARNGGFFGNIERGKG